MTTDFITYNQVTEVRDHFRHRDFDLARRRLLDLAFDLNQPQILQAAINWSRNHPGTELNENAITEALSLLDGWNVPDSSGKEPQLLFDASNISKSYLKGNFRLFPTSLKVHEGEIIGIVGENGNGKTTLLRCIGGQLNGGLERRDYHYLPEEGNFPYQVKQYTGFIPQRIPKWYGRLKNNLHFSAAIAGITGAENALMVDFVLERFGLTKFQDLTWNQISSGYRTRFEIARVLLSRPRLLILDEPLANLDINAQQTLLQDLKFVSKSALKPMGVLLTSQQLYEVEKVADRVLFIRQGHPIYNDEPTTTSGADADTMLFITEFETTASRDKIESVLNGNYTELKFNGGVYQITTSQSTSELVKLLLNEGVELNYYRDITKSTKRFFN